MTAREKLIEILSVPIYPHLDAEPAEVVADYLIDNGVVPVVRCKNCEIEQMCTLAQCLGENGYCSYGERKENAEI